MASPRISRRLAPGIAPKVYSAGSSDDREPQRRNEENMRKPISVGIIGCGYWGPLLVRNFRSLADCTLKAVCDASEARLKHIKGLYPDVDGVTDYQRFIN